MHRSSRIDEFISKHNSQQQKLYEPLRKSLLRSNYLSQNNKFYDDENRGSRETVKNTWMNRKSSAVVMNSFNRINSAKNISHNKNNNRKQQHNNIYHTTPYNLTPAHQPTQLDLSTSRLSRRIRSLSPQQIQQIKSSIYIPINKKLIPTNNYQKIKNKRFSAINVEQKIHEPISEQKLQQIKSSIESNKYKKEVEEIVYEIKQQKDGDYKMNGEVYDIYAGNNTNINFYQHNDQQYENSPHVSMYQSQEILRSVGADYGCAVNNNNNNNNHNNINNINNINNNYKDNRYSVNPNYIPTTNSYLNPNPSAKPGSTIYVNSINNNNNNRNSTNYSIQYQNMSPDHHHNKNMSPNHYNNTNIYTTHQQNFRMNNNGNNYRQISISPRVSFNSKQMDQFVNNNNVVNNNTIRQSMMMNNNNNNNNLYSSPRQSVSPKNVYFTHGNPSSTAKLSSLLPLTLQQPQYSQQQRNSYLSSSFNKNNYQSPQKMLYPRPSLIIQEEQGQKQSGKNMMTTFNRLTQEKNNVRNVRNVTSFEENNVNNVNNVNKMNNNNRNMNNMNNTNANTNKNNNNTNIYSQKSIVSPLNSHTSLDNLKLTNNNKLTSSRSIPAQSNPPLVGAYEFTSHQKSSNHESTSVSSTGQQNSSLLKHHQRDKQFKYNLFSILDETMNMKCETRNNCMQNNQIIAKNMGGSYEWRLE